MHSRRPPWRMRPGGAENNRIACSHTGADEHAGRPSMIPTRASADVLSLPRGLGPFLHFAPNLVLRNRPLKKDGPVVQRERDAPAENRPNRPEISSPEGPNGDQQEVDGDIDRRVDPEGALRSDTLDR